MASMHKTIIDQVKTQTAALSGAPTCVLRDHTLKIRADSLPLVILEMGRETVIQYTFGGGVLRGYEVIFTILYAQNFQAQSGIDDAKSFRDQIRKAFIPDSTVTTILTGVSAVWDCDEIEAPAQVPAKAESGYEEARLALLFKTSEASHA